MVLKNYIFCLFITILGIYVWGCKDEVNVVKSEKLELDIRAIQNRCERDSDCVISGCHGSICRATVEDDFCEHRLVVKLGSEEDIEAISRIIKEILTIRESETLRVGGYSSEQWTFSFHASAVQRDRVIDSLEQIGFSGIFKLHPKAQEVGDRLYESLKIHGHDVKKVKQEGVGELVELMIHSGDVLSKDDIRNSWESVRELINDIEEEGLLLGYEVIVEKRPVMRFWPLDRRQVLLASQWDSLEVESDALQGKIKLSIVVDDFLESSLDRWTQSIGEVLVLSLGRRVIFGFGIGEVVQDGSFEIVYDHGQYEDNAMGSLLESLKVVEGMASGAFYNAESTSKVELDLKCAKEVKRSCECILGHCGWRSNSEYLSCMGLQDEVK